MQEQSRYDPKGDVLLRAKRRATEQAETDLLALFRVGSAHLSSLSPVFKAMFEERGGEAAPGEWLEGARVFDVPDAAEELEGLVGCFYG